MKLRVHSWGGLGSQLFVLAFIYDLRKKFPKKKILLVHHTSGVSRRLFELDSILESNISLKLIDDYQPNQGINQNKNKNVLKYLLIKIIKNILEKLYILINIDQNPDINKIKPWTMIIRGHYSKRLISDKFLSNCVKKFANNGLHFPTSTLIIHYRLGDIINLPGKSIIKPNYVIEKIRKIAEIDKFEQILVYSDTISEAKKLLSPLENLSNSIQFSDESTLTVVQNAIIAKYFIGTNSKVSIWISKFRKHQNLPTELLQN
jgi:hypothetical protein